jgi:MFS family permease
VPETPASTGTPGVLLPPGGDETPDVAAAAQSFRHLIRHRPWRLWIISSLSARLPLSMMPLAFILVGEAADGSVTIGATLTGFGSICACVASPIRGRLLDRQELRSALQLDCLIGSAVFALLLVVLLADLPVWCLFALSIGVGWATAGLMSGLRALLVVAVPSEQLRRSHFVESLLTEICYGIGPVLVAVLGLLGGAELVLITMFVIQTWAALSLRRIGTFPPQPVTRTKLWRRRDVQRLTALTFAVSLGYGTLESNVPQRMPELGLPTEAGGWFLGILATGSCIGGLLVSVRPTSAERPRRSAALLAFAFAVLIVPFALARNAPVFGVSLVVTTLAFVPLVGLLAAEFEHRIGTSQRGEGFAYFVTALTLGGAFGYLGNGVLIGPLAASTLPWFASGLFLAVSALLASNVLFGGRSRGGRRAAPRNSETTSPTTREEALS